MNSQRRRRAAITLPEGVLEPLVPVVAEALPTVIALIPPGAATELGRRRTIDQLASERLLGALELGLERLPLSAPPGLTATLPEGFRSGNFAYAVGSHEGAAASAVRILEQLWPGTTQLISLLAREIATNPTVSALLAPEAGGEEQLADRHGAGHLALTVIVATAVLRELDPPIVGAKPAVIVGASVEAVVDVLAVVPQPEGYAEALLETRRAKYLLPRSAAGSVWTGEHRFALSENDFPAHSDFSANGLVDVAEGGITIRTGLTDSTVAVRLHVLADAPGEVDVAHWDEIVEVSWTAARGFASVLSTVRPTHDGLREQTPPWPGDYRVRVHARGRDEADDEEYELVVWSAPAAPPIVHKRTDRLGHRLRGEPAPMVVPKPWQHYHWVRTSSLQVAATVTIVTGSTADEVVAAFGANPAEPLPLGDLASDHTHPQWVAVLPAEDAVIAIEINGYRGSDGKVLRALSRKGRAGSMFWNVNALTRLSLAAHGTLLASFEPGLQGTPEEIAEYLAGLELEDYHDHEAKGLTAVERFTGHRLTRDQLWQLEEFDVGYEITRG
ncbi:hypothetical protein FPZ12_030575 [Amycolatopsis acidicola]|uniref:Uncharacterized protein n=1 Tax=Amycolatopsis acidicola TaxID=2596893 RepID=A0A5N0USP8_9PSEU|nr:DUF6461 domain-containing protein [Amycolatopsis acidicola]KAA9155013.1 hypothetical protein FPZ12_030575 [Amycolatopsis acidicola]